MFRSQVLNDFALLFLLKIKIALYCYFVVAYESCDGFAMSVKIVTGTLVT